MKRFHRKIAVVFSIALAAIILGCYGRNRSPISRSMDHLIANGGSSESQENSGTSYARYGGQASIEKIVDETWFLLLSDPDLGPTFSMVGKSKGVSVNHVKSCLDLQISVLLDGPGEVPGVSYSRNAPAEGYECQELTQSFSDLGVSPEDFDKFTLHLVDVLKANGLATQDVNRITKTLLASAPGVVTVL